MKIEQIITDAVALTEVTKIPVLFLSNPGLGKTTILKRYANTKGYHLETLIGSRFSPEEISGYQVNNGGDSLTHMNPVWYNSILEQKKKGITTLLFIDEISTCSEAVQGALLSLIFDRTIGNNKFLPEDTVIVSAANYAKNLPVTMNIMTPTLNRFILINLNEGYKAMDMLDEFIDGPDSKNLKKYKTIENFSPEQELEIKTKYKSAWNEIFLKYSDRESSLGYLDISNMALDGLYAENNGYIYNCISGRTISYLLTTLIAYKKMEMKNNSLLHKMIDGLVGAGTCTFKDEQQGHKFRHFTHDMFSKVLSTNKENAEYLPLVGDIVKDVQAYLINQENTGFYQNENLTQVMQIIDEIRKEFTPSNIFEKLKSQDTTASFTAQMEAVIELQQVVSAYPDSYYYAADLTKIAMDFYSLYCDVLEMKPDFNKTFGKSSPLFYRTVFLEKVDKKGKTVYARAAMRVGRSTELPSLYYISPEETFLNASFKKPVHDSDDIRVIHYDKELKKLAPNQYLRIAKKFI